jgi:chemotaxis protein CheY-P-specific phosphatase CheC
MAVQISKEQVKNNAIDSTKLDGSSNYSFSSQIRYTGSDTNTQALATRGYVDSVAAGLDPKDSCKVATTANITLSGTQTIDGVSVSAGDRVLVKAQSSSSANGIYICDAGSWSRSSDMATGSAAAGASMFIEQGTVNGEMGFVCTSNKGADVVGTNDLSFSQYTGASNITAGAALSKTGDQLDVEVDDSTIQIVSDALQLKDAGITNAKIADGTISNGKLVNSTISGVQLGSSLQGLTASATGGLSLSATYNGSAAVSASINLDGASLSTGSNGLKVSTGGISTLMIADDAVTSAKLADASVVTAALAGTSVTADKLADNAVTTAKIADSAVTAQKLAGSIPADKLNLGNGVKEDGGNLVVDLDGSTLALGAGGLSVAAGGIGSTQLAATSVTAAKLASNAVETAKIADDAVTAAKIADAAIDSARLDNNAVTTAKIANANVTAAKLNFMASYETLSAGDGTATTFDAGAAADATMLGGAIVFRNGLAMGLVESSPSGQDQYTLSATGGASGRLRVTFGAAPNAGDQITVMYFQVS